MYDFLNNFDIFKALNMSYMLIIINIIKIQRCWKKYKYGKLSNITKLLINRQLNNKVSVEKYVRKRIPSIDTLHNFGDLEIIFMEDLI